MKALSLTTSLLAALSLSAFAGSYTVKSGDTLHSISRKHKVSVSKIMSMNKISDPTKLRIGQTITVSGSSSKAKRAPKKTGNYKVSRGDTFYSIARRHGISVSKLKALNPRVNSNRISPGQTLAVSGTPKKIAKKPAKNPVTQTIAKISTPKKPLEREIENPVSIKFSTAPSLATKVTDPAPEKETVAVVASESTPISTPPAPPVVEDVMIDPPILEQPVPTTLPTSPTTITSVILTEETTFEEFASKYGTDTAQLNALNGWNLPKATVLARGSEIYVPQ